MNDERARQGVEHLQAAAVEVIAALRAFLDVAEDVVRDPSAVTAFAASLIDIARPPGGATPTGSRPDDAGGPEDTSAEPRVTRIRVS